MSNAYEPTPAQLREAAIRIFTMAGMKPSSAATLKISVELNGPGKEYLKLELLDGEASRVAMVSTQLFDAVLHSAILSALRKAVVKRLPLPGKHCLYATPKEAQ